MKTATGNNKNNWTEQEKEIIRQKAYLLWENDPDQSDDQHYWHEAEKELEAEDLFIFDPRRWYFELEKHLLEPVLSWLKRQSLFEILSIIGRLAVLTAVIMYIGGEEERYYQKVSESLQTLSNPYLKKVPYVAVKAAENLNSSPLQFPYITLKQAWEALTKDSTAQKAWAKDSTSTAQKVWVEDSTSTTRCKQKVGVSGYAIIKHREKQQLSFVDWQDAKLAGVRLCSATFSSANLEKIDLSLAALDGSDFLGSKLKNAILISASLQETNFSDADLSGADLQDANLRGADLNGANLNGANLNGAILEGVQSLTNTQIKSACSWDKAVYKVNWYKAERMKDPKTKEWLWKIWQAKEPENQEYIQKIKQDKKSDPTSPPKCSKLSS